MRLNSARQAWHDCMYTPWDSVMAVAVEWARLGTAVQASERDRRNQVAMHQALAGHIQQAIGSLPAHLQAFGNWLYSPMADDDHREIAEELVFVLAQAGGKRMTAATFERARYVAAGVLFRYRRQHQGGQSAGVDPLPSAEAFRGWLLAEYGAGLDSRNWARDWEEFVDACFAACNDLDRRALAPVSVALRELCEEAA